MSANVRRVTVGGQTFVVGAGTHDEFWDRCEQGWESTTFDVLASRLRPGSTFVDVGAWIGPMTLAAAARGARVIAYEPDPAAADELESNVALNRGLDIAVERVALWTSTGTRLLRGGPAGLGESMSSFNGKAARHGSVVVSTIDVRDAARSWPSATLLKIDVEGGEYRLIPRLRGHIATCHPTMILSVHGYDVRASLPAWPAPLRRVVHHLHHAARTMPLLSVVARAYRPLLASDHHRPEWHRVSPVELMARIWERELLLESPSTPTAASRTPASASRGRTSAPPTTRTNPARRPPDEPPPT